MVLCRWIIDVVFVGLDLVSLWVVLLVSWYFCCVVVSCGL